MTYQLNPLHRHFPRLKALLKSIENRLQGLPPISYSKISPERIRELLNKEDPVILEIGCNDGEHSLWFLEHFKTPKIYCFEPDPRAIRRFKANVGQNPNIQLFEIALSNHNGEIDFYQSDGDKNNEKAQAMTQGWTSSKEMPEGWDLSGSIRAPKKHLDRHPWVTFDQKIKVTTSTLDAWCDRQGITDIDLIWMDVQGAEIDVFQGGTQALARTRFIYTEYSNKELYEGQMNLKKMMEFLNSFDCVTRYPSDVLLKNERILKQ